MNQPKVVAITATSGRHKCIERSVRMFLDQDYENCQQLIFQNSMVEQRLNTNINPEKILLVNQHIDSQTKKPYSNLGAIYRDALSYIPQDADIITFWDDDDLFHVQHISEGVAGLIRGGKTAYKPKFSLFRTDGRVQLVNNTLEPSIFMKAAHILQHGFSETTSDQHLQWVHPLIQSGEIFQDELGKATLCYNWGDEFFTFKTSGDPNNKENFSNYRKRSHDHGDGIITPISKDEAGKYYKLFELCTQK